MTNRNWTYLRYISILNKWELDIFVTLIYKILGAGHIWNIYIQSKWELEIFVTFIYRTDRDCKYV